MLQLCLLIFVTLWASQIQAQTQPQAQPQTQKQTEPQAQTPTQAQPQTQPQAQPTGPKLSRAFYVLGPDDQISIWVLGMEEIGDKPYRIDFQGFLDIPLLGRVKAAGMTIEELKADLSIRVLQVVRKAELTVNVIEFRSQPVSVVGAVNTPGLLQLQGRKTLMEMLSMAGGLRQDAGYSVVITRRVEWGPIPLAGSTLSQTGEFNVAEIRLKNLMEAAHPEDNIAVFPNDVITVPRGEMYYVLGDVKKSGGFIMGEKKTVSVLQAISTAEGMTVTAASKNARILRTVPGVEERVETIVDLTKILSGKAHDMQLGPNDILFIPTSTAKRISTRTIETALNLGTGLLIWR